MKDLQKTAAAHPDVDECAANALSYLRYLYPSHRVVYTAEQHGKFRFELYPFADDPQCDDAGDDEPDDEVDYDPSYPMWRIGELHGKPVHWDVADDGALAVMGYYISDTDSMTCSLIRQAQMLPTPIKVHLMDLGGYLDHEDLDPNRFHVVTDFRGVHSTIHQLHTLVERRMHSLRRVPEHRGNCVDMRSGWVLINDIAFHVDQDVTVECANGELAQVRAGVVATQHQELGYTKILVHVMADGHRVMESIGVTWADDYTTMMTPILVVMNDVNRVMKCAADSAVVMQKLMRVMQSGSVVGIQIMGTCDITMRPDQVQDLMGIFDTWMVLSGDLGVRAVPRSLMHALDMQADVADLAMKHGNANAVLINDDGAMMVETYDDADDGVKCTMSTITLIYGEMGCGKTQMMLTRYWDLANKGVRIMVVKPDAHVRDGDYAASRNGESVFAEPLSQVLQSNALDADVVMLDEVQFADPDDLVQLIQMCDDADVDLMMYGLLNHAFMRPFPASAVAMSMADQVVHMPSSCAHVACRAQAQVSARVERTDPCSNMYRVLHDGPVDDQQASYAPLCRRCYRMNTVHINPWHIKN